jgi:hypothetical protein
MSILARLWRYVHINGNGYPLPSSSALVPPASLASTRRARGSSRSARLEYMEQRILMTTLLGGERFTYTDARGNAIIAQVNGAASVTELIAATQDGDGSLLFGDIEGRIIANSDPNAPVDPRLGDVVGNGAIPVSGGLQGSAQLGFPPAQLNFGGIASNQGGTTYGFNIFDVDGNGKTFTTYPITGDPITITTVNGNTTTTTTEPVPWDLQYFQISNTTGNASNVVDLTNVLEGIDGGNPVTTPPPAGSPPGTPPTITITPGLEPDLLGATKVRIAGAAFSPVDGLLYFDLQFTPKSTGGTGGTIPQQDVLYSIDASAANNDIPYLPGSTTPGPGTSTLTRIGNLDNGGGTYTISALTFQSTGAGTATLYTYLLPAGGAATGAFVPEPTLATQQQTGPGTFTGAAGGVLTVINAAVVTFGYHPQAATPTYLTGVTGLVALPATLPGAQGNYLFATNGDELVRIDLDNLVNGSQFFPGALTSTNFGSTTDEIEVNTPGDVAPFDGNSLIGLTYNPNVVDPFTGTRGVLESYDNANGTQDTVFVSDRLRISAGDVFAVYTNQADINSTISFQVVTFNTNGTIASSKAYAGSFGSLNTDPTGTANVNVAAPVSGGGFLGFIGTVPNPFGTTPITDQAFLSGTMASSLGIFPGDFTTIFGGTPVDAIFPGLTVGYGLEQTLDAGEYIISQTLGQNFTAADGLAISRGGLVAVINSTLALGGGTQDSLAFVNEVTGAIDSGVVPVTDGDGDVLTGNQGIAYGSVNLDGNEALYAVYDVDFDDGNGSTPTLGIITPTFDPMTGQLVSAVFTPVGSAGLGLGVNSKVEGIAFAPGSSAYDPSHQALYIIADPDATDNDVTGTLYQVDPTTGTIVDTDGIGQILSQDGVQVFVGSATFNAAGQLLVQDKQSGRLLDVNLNDGTAGATISTQPGTINPTVGAISLDPTTGQLYAIDNETTLQGDGHLLAGGPGVNPISGSALLVQIRNPSVANSQDVSLGKFLFDGTVTGRVFVSGSIGTFYAGWLIVGDANQGSEYIVGGNLQGTDPTLLTQNFVVNGDVGNLLGYASMGTNGVPNAASGLPGYETGLDVLIGGKLGELNTDGMFAGHTQVQDNNGIPNVPDNGLPEAAIQTQNQYYEITPNAGNVSSDFANGLLVQNGVAPFSDQTFNNAQYLGTIRNQITGQPDVVSLDGELFGLNGDGSAGPAPVDYYGISLLAGQTVIIQVATYLEDAAAGLATQVGIFNPEGLLIATDQSDVDPLAIGNQPITLTATEAGVYRIAVGEPGNDNFAVPAASTAGRAQTLENPDYHLTVTGLGDLAIGGFVTGGSLILTGAPTSVNISRSIEAVRGDVGAIVAGQQRTGTGNGDAILAPFSSEFAAFSQQPNTSTASYTLVAAPTEDLAVDNGSLRAVVALSIGRQIGLNDETDFASFGDEPDIYVPNGTFGLLQASGTGTNDILSATFGYAAGGDIQHIEAAADIGGVFRTNKGFGVIEAANMTLGSANTEFHANVDGIGSDGIIDLISVTGDFGELDDGGPAIITGPGGNVRFIHVGGNVTQDLAFGAGQTEFANGSVQQSPGTVSFTDDSGSKIVLTPSQIQVPLLDPTTGLQVLDPVTGLGEVTTAPNPVGLITRTYGIRGSGGVVVLNVVSTSGLSVSASTSGAAVGTAEVGEIDLTGGLGEGLITLPNGAPSLPVAPGPFANVTTILPQPVNIAITGGHLDIYDITNAAGGTIDSITNDTGGDILNMNTGDVGTLSDSAGNLGSTTSSTGQAVQAVNQIIAGGTVYPFNNQHVGIVIGNVATISAGKSIGNILASGVIGTITANTLGNSNPALFYGIDGPIVANGFVTPPGTTTTANTTAAAGVTITKNGDGSTTTVTIANGVATTVVSAPIPAGLTFVPEVSIVQVNIGNGILSSGTGAASQAGIYASSGIVSVTGNNADIRGNIISASDDTTAQSWIGKITLNNGSIIDANIEVLSTFAESLEYSGGGVLPSFAPQSQTTPFSYIGSITTNGNGGIIGTYIVAPNIGKVTVNAGGFGILNTDFYVNGDGIIDTVSAAGYGLRLDNFNSGSIRNLIATGNGSAIPLTAFDPGVQSSQPTDGSFAANSTGFGPNPLTDLEAFILGDPASQQPASPSGLTTGVIEEIDAEGSSTLGNITAFELVGSNIAFAQSIGTINITSSIIPYVIQAPDIDVVPNTTILTALGTAITTGGLKSLTVGGDVVELDLQVAGKSGPIIIGGNLSAYINPLASISGDSEIFIKGPSGDITSINVYGSVTTGANIIIQGVAGSIVIGSPNKKGVSTGDFSGNLTIQGDHPAPAVITLLEIFGSIIGGNFDIIGTVGTINVAHSLTGDFTVDGNLGTLIVGSDAFHSGDVLGGTFTVEGNVGNISVTGAAIGTVLIEGNAGNISIFSDGASPNLVAINAVIDTQGTIGNLTITGGNVAGIVDAGRTLTKATIRGSVIAGGSITSSLGNISNLSITGNVAGAITAPNGNIANLTVSGSFLAGSTVTANSLTKLTNPGSFGGTMTITNGLANATFGTIAAGAVIEAAFIGGIRTSGDSLGNISSAINNGTKASVLTIGGNLGGTSNFGAPLTITVGKNINAGAHLNEAGTLTSLKVGGAIEGEIAVGGQIVSLTAGAAVDAVITSGFGMTKVAIKGAVIGSIIQAGLAPGNDGIFGTGDLGEQSRMADITSLTVGSMNDSVVAAGGNITTFKSGGALINSSVSSGLVLGGANIEAVLDGESPLTNVANLADLRKGATLYSGNFITASVGGAGLVNSALTAGVSPGADGIFNPAGTGDDSVSTSLTGGTSFFGSVKAHVDASSAILSASGGKFSSTVGYTLANGVANSITGNDPLGTLAVTATPGAPALYSDGLGNTLSISVVGAPGATVSIYGSGDAPNIVITGAGAKPLAVTIITSTPGVLNLGRVLTTDGTQLGTFVTNGYLVGDGVNTVPQLWIDSAMTTFSVAGFATNGTTNNAAWSGQIGGAVKNLTVGIQGPGTLRVGGNITNLNVGSSTGNPLLQQLGTAVVTGITQLATNSAGVTYAYSNGYVFSIDPNTGAALSVGVPVQTATGLPVAVTGLDFDSSGTLYGVGSVDNQSPTVAAPNPISIGDQLHALAINPTNGLAYAINTDVDTGLDELVSIDPTTGADTVIGTLKDAFADTFTHNVLALAFTTDGTLYGIINDRDGNGTNFTTATGDAFVQIATSDPTGSGFIRVSNPSVGGSALPGTAIRTGGAADAATYTGLVADPTTANVFYATRVSGGVTSLDRITLTNGATPNTTTVTAVPLGNVTVNGANTNIVGIGFDENANLIGLDENGSSGDLVAINRTTPASSAYITTPSTIPHNLAGFAVSLTGTVRTTYAYTTDPDFGGTFYSSPGVVSTLGTINVATGVFSEHGALNQDQIGTPLAGTVTSIAIDKTANNPTDMVTVLTSNGVLAQYNAFNGFLIGTQPLGTIVDAITHQRLDITHIAYDNTGRLYGIDATNHRLDALSTTSMSLIINGQPVTAVLATALTEVGTANAADLAAFDYDSNNNTFLALDSADNAFVRLLGVDDGALAGIIAPSITTVNISSGTYAGRINATGVGVGNSITTINARTAGNFEGDIVTAGSIGSFLRFGEFAGTILAGADFKSAVVGGDVLSDGTISAGGTLTGATITGGLLGSILANNATKLSIGTIGSGGDLNVNRILTTLSINGGDAGTIHSGNVTSFTDFGPLLAGSSTVINGDAVSIVLAGGTNAGSTILVDGNVTKSFIVGGTLSGTVATRLNVASATLYSLVDGLFSVGVDLAALTVNGTTFDSLIAVGTWVGFDGVYNTKDDIIYGGSLGTGKFAGTFTDSAITAGVLPSLSAAAGPANNIPQDNRAFTGNPSSANISEISSTESGGIALSNIGTLTFSRGVVSTDTALGNLSVAAAANGIGKINGGLNLNEVILNNPEGQLQLANDPVTGLPLATRVSATELQVAFNKPVDTSTLTAANISVINAGTGLPVPGVTFSYSSGVASDGITKLYFLTITDNSTFPALVTLVIRNLSDNFGTRTSLLDFNQDGVLTNNPFSIAPNEPIVDVQL